MSEEHLRVKSLHLGEKVEEVEGRKKVEGLLSVKLMAALLILTELLPTYAHILREREG